MKVIKTEKIKLDNFIQLYDIQNTKNHNYIIKGNKYDYVSHNCGLLDEVSFGRNKGVSLQKNAMMKTYNTVKERMKSRFIGRQGNDPTMLFLVSSKRAESDFLEQYAKKIKGNPYTYIVDEPIWKVKPEGTYSGKTFRVAVGNKFLNSQIIPDNELDEVYLKQNYTIIKVPIELKEDYEKDIDAALMNSAGISSSSIMKFISGLRLSNCLIENKNPFSKEIISLGLDDDFQIKDFFDTDVVKEKDYNRPIYIHIDTSLSGDITGLAGVMIEGAKSNAQESAELYYRQLFGVGIKAPSDSQISLEKTRQFIYYLKDLGWNIKRISVDGYESADTQQILKTKGFNAIELSMDKAPCLGYSTFKAAINERRIGILSLEKTIKEIVELEKDNSTNKVDHPEKGTKGSKDLSDALAGAIYNASLTKEEYLFNNGEDLQLSVEINNLLTNDKAQVMQDLQNILKQDSQKAKQDAQKILDRIPKTIDYTQMTTQEQKKKTKELLDKDYEDVYTPSYLNDIIVF